VRKANNRADQHEEHDELEVFDQKDSHRSPTLLFLRKPLQPPVRAMWVPPHRNSIGKSTLAYKAVIKIENCDNRYARKPKSLFPLDVPQ
jgi:hypothetical protein